MNKRALRRHSISQNRESRGKVVRLTGKPLGAGAASIPGTTSDLGLWFSAAILLFVRWVLIVPFNQPVLFADEAGSTTMAGDGADRQNARQP